MDNKSNEQFLFIQATVDANNQEADEKHMKTDEKLTHITEIHMQTDEKLTQLTEDLKVLSVFMMNQTNNYK